MTRQAKSSCKQACGCISKAVRAASFLTRGSGIEKQPVSSRHYYFPIQVASFSFSSGTICLIGASPISWRAAVCWCVGERLLNGGDCFGCCFQSRSPRFTMFLCVEPFAVKPRRLANLFHPFLFARKGCARRGMSDKRGAVGTLPQERRFGRRRAALLLPPSLRDTPLRDGGFPPAAEWPFTREKRLRLDDAIPRVGSGPCPPA